MEGIANATVLGGADVPRLADIERSCGDTTHPRNEVDTTHIARSGCGGGRCAGHENLKLLYSRTRTRELNGTNKAASHVTY